MIKIFISHSSKDSASAAALAELLRSALTLSKSDIRCTSVDGYRLPGGVNSEEQLRQEVREAPVLLGLISHESFESAYVLFELGARWGANLFMIPVLAHGVSASILRGPLSALNALSCDSASQLHQLVANVADKLALQSEQAAAYQEDLNRLLMAGKNSASAGEAPGAPLPSNQAHSEVDEYANSHEVIRRYCEAQWKNDYRMRAHCEKQQTAAVDKLRRVAGDVPADVFAGIRAQAAKDWPDDFVMREHTEQDQLKAFRELHNG